MVISMQALQLARRTQTDQDWANEDEAESDYNLLIKIADTQSTSRVVPLRGLRDDMKRAWNQSYAAISEVQSNLFLACFKTYQSINYVWKRQPWIVGRRDTLLLEWLDPNKDISEYIFQNLYVTVKFFGIPIELRTVDLLESLLNQVGEPSYLEQINAQSLFRDAECITARANINITKTARDKITISTREGSYIIAYVHYEKISKICTYCAAFFRNADNCDLRQNKLISTSSSASTQPVPFIRYGPRMSQISKLPRHEIQS